MCEVCVFIRLYADDSSCIAAFEALVEWLNLLLLDGPKYGYFPEPENSYLVVHPDFIEIAKEKFKDFKLNIVTGYRFLGGFIGNEDDVNKWLNQKVDVWVKSVEKLASAAHDQHAYMNPKLLMSLLQNLYSVNGLLSKE